MSDKSLLLKILQQELAALKELVTCTIKEREALVSHNHQELQEQIDAKKNLQEIMFQLETARLKLTGDKSLAEIIAASPKESLELARCRDKMKSLARELQSLSQTNHILLKQGLAYLDTIKKEADPLSKAQGYGKNAKVSASQAASLVISKQA